MLPSGEDRMATMFAKGTWCCVTPRRQVLAWGKTLECHQAWFATDTENHAARALCEGRGAAAEPICDVLL